MRVFVAGASGAIGRRLVPQLIEAGHDVVGTYTTPSSAELVRRLGATPVKLDLLDAGAVRRAVLASEPEAIVHQATALANVKFSRNMDKVAARTSELRDRHTARLRPRAAGPGRARRGMGAAGRRRSPGPHRRAHSARRSRRLGRR